MKETDKELLRNKTESDKTTQFIQLIRPVNTFLLTSLAVVNHGQQQCSAAQQNFMSFRKEFQIK